MRRADFYSFIFLPVLISFSGSFASGTLYSQDFSQDFFLKVNKNPNNAGDRDVKI